MAGNQRTTLPEGGGGLPLSSLGEVLGIPVTYLDDLFAVSSRRLRSELRLRDDPFSIDEGSVRANGIAGVVRLAPEVEIEVVPKCFDSDTVEWHDDFLTLATVTRLGRVFRREQVAASLRPENKDILTLLAAMFLEYLERLNRVPIREYRKSSWTNPTLDGELDYAEVWSARPEGFVQTGSLLSVDNPFMAVIGAAALYLGDKSTDPGIAQRLRRIASALPNVVRGRTPDRVPGRYARWQHIYDLAIAVQAGLGMQLEQNGGLRAPGFVLNTERGWEDLLSLALTAQGSELGARIKPASKLGTRFPTGRDVLTYPDVVLNPPSFTEPIVIDAKYKGSAAGQVEQIAADDLYEALAFLKAQQARVAILVYPGGKLTPTELPLGTVVPFDEISMGSLCVMGASVSVQGIGRTRGFDEFGYRLGQSLLQLARQAQQSR